MVIKFNKGAIEPPVGSIVAWAKSISGVPQTLPDNWVVCDGSSVSDADSPLNGQNVPNLNGAGESTKKFLRGASTSGGAGSSYQHRHGAAQGATTGKVIHGSSERYTDYTSHVPPYYEVVWIIRIK